MRAIFCSRPAVSTVRTHEACDGLTEKFFHQLATVDSYRLVACDTAFMN